ncbi:response regulator transcription factor [Streptomyces sp. NPDC004980]
MTTRILIADDQALIRAGLRALIESDPELEVVGEAATGREALRLVRTNRADVVLMDIRMPDLDGLEATRAISADEDLVGVKVLILTTFEVDQYVLEALRAGASGFLGKGAGPRELLDGIRTIARGDALLSATATSSLIARLLAQPEIEKLATPARLATLTPRETEILALVAAGLSNDDIAARLFVATVTVKTHVNRTMTKLQVRDRAQLVVIAYQSGFVGVPAPPPGSRTTAC